MKMLLYVVCTAGKFVWNEAGVVLLPAPYITLRDFDDNDGANSIREVVYWSNQLRTGNSENSIQFSSKLTSASKNCQHFRVPSRGFEET